MATIKEIDIILDELSASDSKIELGKIITIFNEFIEDKNSNDFITFCKSKGYIKGNILYFPDDTANTYLLNFSNSNTKKIKSIVNFIKTSRHLFNKDDILNIVTQISNYTSHDLKSGFNITSDKIDAEDVDSLPLSISPKTDETEDNKEDKKDGISTDKNGTDLNFKIRKQHKVRNFVGKKMLVPALITGSLTGIGGAIISALRTVIGSSVLLSTVPALEVAAIGSLGFTIGALATPIIIGAKNYFTRLYYHKRYGIKSKNFSILDSKKVETIDDLKSAKLPITQLCDKIIDTNNKITELKNKGINPFRHPINALRTFLLTKINRNRLHEVVGFTKLLSERANNPDIPDESKVKYDLLQKTIANYKNELIDAEIDRLEQIKDKNPGKKQLFEYIDILAKEQLAREDKKTTPENVFEKSQELIKNRIEEKNKGEQSPIDDTIPDSDTNSSDTTDNTYDYQLLDNNLSNNIFLDTDDAGTQSHNPPASNSNNSTSIISYIIDNNLFIHNYNIPPEEHKDDKGKENKPVKPRKKKVGSEQAVKPNNEPKDEPKPEPKDEDKSEPAQDNSGDQKGEEQNKLVKKSRKKKVGSEQTVEPKTEPKDEPKTEPKDEHKPEPKDEDKPEPKNNPAQEKNDDKGDDKTTNTDNSSKKKTTATKMIKKKVDTKKKNPDTTSNLETNSHEIDDERNSYIMAEKEMFEFLKTFKEREFYTDKKGTARVKNFPELAEKTGLNGNNLRAVFYSLKNCLFDENGNAKPIQEIAPIGLDETFRNEETLIYGTYLKLKDYVASIRKSEQTDSL